MAKEQSNAVKMIPWVATLITAAVVLITSITFDGPGFGKTWPLIPTVLFASLALTFFMADAGAAWPGMIFVSSFFLLWLLGNTKVAPFSKTWPFLLVVAVVLIFLTVAMAKKKKK